MLYPEKQVQITMPLDILYGILGLLAREKMRGAIWGGCKTDNDDIPKLGAMYEKTMEDMLFLLDGAGYCEHVKEAAEEMRKAKLGLM